MNKNIRISVLIMTLIMSVMLFTSNPLDDSQRLYHAIWNTGHLFFFALFSWLLLTQTRIRQFSWLMLFAMSICISLLLGVVIEVIQLKLGRYMELQDLFLDVLGGVIGALAAIAGLPAERQPFIFKKASFLYPVFIVLVLLLAFYPVYKVAIDDFNMQRDFPVLANFESEDELARWENNLLTRFERDTHYVKNGEYSILVEFGLGEYPVINLNHFVSDWTGYKRLNINIHSAQQGDLPIELKIFDQQHIWNGYDYYDRFNHNLVLKSGWNAIKIKLSDIAYAPKGRAMDLANIKSISLFLYQPEQPNTIHLDYINLSK